jgi:hypothetical protein
MMQVVARLIFMGFSFFGWVVTGSGYNPAIYKMRLFAGTQMSAVNYPARQTWARSVSCLNNPGVRIHDLFVGEQPRFLLAILAVAFLSSCATLPPGSDYPKKASLVLLNPAQTRLGRQFEKAAHEHNGNSGFRIITAGSDGLLVRMQMINTAVIATHCNSSPAATPLAHAEASKYPC